MQQSNEAAKRGTTMEGKSESNEDYKTVEVKKETSSISSREEPVNVQSQDRPTIGTNYKTDASTNAGFNEEISTTADRKDEVEKVAASKENDPIIAAPKIDLSKTEFQNEAAIGRDLNSDKLSPETKEKPPSTVEPKSETKEFATSEKEMGGDELALNTETELDRKTDKESNAESEQQIYASGSNQTLSSATETGEISRDQVVATDAAIEIETGLKTEEKESDKSIEESAGHSASGSEGSERNDTKEATDSAIMALVNGTKSITQGKEYFFVLSIFGSILT